MIQTVGGSSNYGIGRLSEIYGFEWNKTYFHNNLCSILLRNKSVMRSTLEIECNLVIVSYTMDKPTLFIQYMNMSTVVSYGSD